MAINQITQDDFDAYAPQRSPMAQVMAEEVEWYADDRGIIIGTVFRDRTDNDWAYIILGRDEHDSFRGFKLDASLENIAEARRKLLVEMTAIEASGQTEFPQGD